MEEKKEQSISLAAATAIVVASMVGTGVFTSLGFQIGSIPSGFAVLLLWVVGGIVALCGALSYAELASMMPRSGGEYHLLGRTYHPLIGFLAGWVSITAGFTAPVALMAMAFGAYAHGVWPAVDAVTASYSVVIVLTLLRLAGVSFIAKFHVSITIVKVLTIVAFVVGAIWLGKSHWEVLTPKAGDTARVFSLDFATSLFWVMFSYSGWNAAAYVAGDMRNPQRNVPLALGCGTLIVMALYVTLNAVFLTGGDWAAMNFKEEVGLIAARNIFGETGGAMMGGIIAFGLLSTINALLWSGSTTLRVIGQDMKILRWLSASDRRGEPIGAVLTMSVVALILLATGSFRPLLNYIQALLELCAAMVVAGVIWMRIKRPEMPRPFKVPFFPLPPLLFISVSAWMLYSLVKMHPMETIWGAATLVVGAALYFLSGKNQD